MIYNSLLDSKTSGKWQRAGVKRRAGVALPLFSIYSKKSTGIGEIPDLRYIIDWCNQTGISILQLLPLNELGTDFSPYNSISTFALEPMYLSIKKLRNVDLKNFRKDIRTLKRSFPKNNEKVNYEIKTEKLKLLGRIFETVDLSEIKKYKKYVKDNFHWLKYFSLFKILTEKNGGKNWQEWDLKYKYISMLTVEKILRNNSAEVNFQCWLQWQLYEQLTTIKKYAKRKNILVMGDLPFLVSRNSSDVWAYKNYFKLSLSSGAPPDMYFSKGQRWGMPPYNWENIESDNYGYIKERLKYAENFFDMFRIDHFVGLFRVWTVDLKTPEDFGGLYGKFDPEDENLWEEHGRKILTELNENTLMLPCAEDLGTIPQCSEKVLKEFGITGINVQRWEKKWNDNFNFLPAEEYRINSAATVSTHDSSSLPDWLENEAGTVDELSFKMICEKNNITDENYIRIKQSLFEENHSHNEKLYWRKQISNVYVLLNLLNLNYPDAKEIIDMYLSSFGEKNKFLKYIGLSEHSETKTPHAVVKKSLEKINSSGSVFSIQLIMEYLYLDKDILEKFSSKDFRINFPGTVSGKNWTLRLPIPLEGLKELSINKTIREILFNADRS